MKTLNFQIVREFLVLIFTIASTVLIVFTLYKSLQSFICKTPAFQECCIWLSQY